MSINDATRFDWDRASKITDAGNLSPSLLDKYRELAEEEQRLKDLERPVYEDEDVVNNPTHYNTGGIECIDSIQESMSDVAFKGYLKGNVQKYIWRYEDKGTPLIDLQKAQVYLGWLIKVEKSNG